MKDLKISKELIKAVLNIPKENIVDIYMDVNYLLIKKDNNRIEEHNIYELAFKCKEWAWKNFEIMLISHYTGQCYINGDLSYLKLNWWTNTKSYQVEDNTEIEAIIKACEWILSEVNK
ncbi:hypothetical protein N5T66_04065 [Aliarcobacter cryaerophilus]|uniref:hypothetical protein n=1 Tax=Aliarcobacter cryaerophilus TaxID=28198 RepID=UPI0021B2CDF5|nr:hypothetical protein [Aliarcobacter cryaerophilus]MCT7432446.1 hypothetical protein [Aliarcobacter cryaerophilus]